MLGSCSRGSFHATTRDPVGSLVYRYHMTVTHERRRVMRGKYAARAANREVARDNELITEKMRQIDELNATIETLKAELAHERAERSNLVVRRTKEMIARGRDPARRDRRTQTPPQGTDAQGRRPARQHIQEALRCAAQLLHRDRAAADPRTQGTVRIHR